MRRTDLLPVLLLGLAAGGCDASGGAPGGPGGGGEPFVMTSRDPRPGAYGIPTTADIEVGFNQVVDPASVDAASLAITGFEFTALTVDGPKLRLTPVIPLQPGTKYTIAIAPDIRGIDGDPLGAVSPWTFMTAGDTPPPPPPPLGPRPR